VYVYWRRSVRTGRFRHAASNQAFDALTLAPGHSTRFLTRPVPPAFVRHLRRMACHEQATDLRVQGGQPFTYDLFDSLKTFRVWASWAFVRRIGCATELLLGMQNNAAISS
jgi:hypothetical protein